MVNDLLDNQDLEFRRQRGDFLYKLYSDLLTAGTPKPAVERMLRAAASSRYSTMTPEEVEGLIQRLGL